MRAIEETAGRLGLPIPRLIERAGRAVDSAARDLAPVGPALILAGPGNNGSDGLTAARRMHGRGESVTVYAFRRPDLSGYAGPYVRAEDDETGERLRRLLGRSAVVIDALLGTGQSRPAEGALARILDTVEDARSDARQYIAVDIPTGVDADSGRVLGPVFRAGATICMGFLKRGVVTYPGATYAGRLLIAGLGIDPSLAPTVGVQIHGDGDIMSVLPYRSAEGNKGSSGRLLSIGGSADFVGAPTLVALGAYRAGAGLVEVAIPAAIRDAVSAHAFEPVYRLLPDDQGRIAPPAADALVDAAERARAIALGPGMGLSDGTVDFVRRLMHSLRDAGPRAVLVDADGLNALARIDKWWDVDLPRILTPHPGEMARLTEKSIQEIQTDRIGVAREYAARWNSVVVLKGAGTVVAEPNGDVTVNTTGGPNLATAGTGDVLSGIIGGLLAQGCSLGDAAVAGVYIHGRAGDIVRSRRGDAGTVASDLLGAVTAARLSLSGGDSGER